MPSPDRCSRGYATSALSALLLLGGCSGDATNGDDGASTAADDDDTTAPGDSGDPDDTAAGEVDCQPQRVVSQTLFVGEAESIVLVDVPDGWTPEPFTNQVGYEVVAPSEFATDRPDVSITNIGRFDGSLVQALTADLTPVTSVTFGGGEIEVFLQANQPPTGTNLEAYFPTAETAAEFMHVTVLTRYVGSPEDQMACDDSLRDLAVLVAGSLRENPDWAG